MNRTTMDSLYFERWLNYRPQEQTSMNRIPDAAAVNRLLAALRGCPQGATLGGLTAWGDHDPNTISYAVAMSLIEVRQELVQSQDGVERIARYFAKR